MAEGRPKRVNKRSKWHDAHYFLSDMVMIESDSEIDEPCEVCS